MKEVLPEVLEERKDFIMVKSRCGNNEIKCEKESIAGTVSQRACVYCGARVVLNPITDAVHLVHGSIGCASYTWDIRGSLSSEENMFRNGFSTDLREKDIIFGGEKKLEAAIDEIVEKLSPKLIFVYATCVVGVIGDDIEAVCRKMEAKHSCRVIPIKSSGFSGTKPLGYKLACGALLQLMGDEVPEKEKGINILGDYNHGGEIWILEGYLKRLGIDVIAKITGDSTYEQLLQAPKASLNIVECSGSTAFLANQMEKKFGIPSLRVRFIGFEDIRNSLIQIAEVMGGKDMVRKALQLIEEEEERVQAVIAQYRERLKGKKAAIFCGGTYKAISLIRQLNDLGIKTVLCGTQNGNAEDYRTIRDIADEGAVILNDGTPSELERFVREQEAEIFIGGVKERTLALKMGISFVDFNHDRKYPLSTYEGIINLAGELDLTSNNPVWDWAKTEFKAKHKEVRVRVLQESRR